MMVWSINLLVLSIGFLIVGMIKPNWILFWMEKPVRMPIILLSAVLFMAAAVMFGEATREKQVFEEAKTQQLSKEKATSDAPKVVEKAQ